jgi:hypothetical protein
MTRAGHTLITVAPVCHQSGDEVSLRVTTVMAYGIARCRTGVAAEQDVIAAPADKACRPGWFALFRLAGRRSSGLPGQRERLRGRSPGLQRTKLPGHMNATGWPSSPGPLALECMLAAG